MFDTSFIAGIPLQPKIYAMGTMATVPLPRHLPPQSALLFTTVLFIVVFFIVVFFIVVLFIIVFFAAAVLFVVAFFIFAVVTVIRVVASGIILILSTVQKLSQTFILKLCELSQFQLVVRVVIAS